VFLCTTILLGAGPLRAADGTYQRTKDGKTLVWNADPNPGDLATWSGDRDKDGYAAGFGTLNWYSRKANGPEVKQTLYASYFGNMLRGKLDGPVNGHSKGVTNHAYFIEGKRASQWAAGPVPSWRMPEPKTEVPSPPQEPQKPRDIIAGEFYPPPPSYAVATAERQARPNHGAVHSKSAEIGTFDVPAEGPNSSEKERVAPPSDENRPKMEIDSSLRSLVGPPPVSRSAPRSSDRNKDQTGSKVNNKQLKTSDVIALADAQARKDGYDVSAYRRSNPQFDQIDDSWSVVYEPSADDKRAKAGKRFVVAVDDKTKRTALVQGQ
jgi:hypothetical protein